MFLNSVIVVLREMLEAALLVSVMLVFTYLLNKEQVQKHAVKGRWVAYAISVGVVGAWIYAAYMPEISQWFDYVGQEVVNASIQITILILLVLYSFVVLKSERKRMVLICMVGVVALSIIREASEIILYINGVSGQPENFTPVLLGGLIGAGIGLSTGTLLFYGLINLSRLWSFRISLLVLALVAGNMASQAVLLLTQADWLPYTSVAWDTSLLLPENTVAGQLLYALIGYEATPSILQLGCYLLGAAGIVFSPLLKMVRSKNIIKTMVSI